MKGVLVPIDKAGRVVLPKHIRDEMAISPGDFLNVSVNGDEVTLRPKKVTNGFVRRGKALVFSTSGGILTREAAQAIIAQVHEERQSEVQRGLQKRKRPE